MQPNAANWNDENELKPAFYAPNALRQLSGEELARHKLLGLAISRGWLDRAHHAEANDRLLENLHREAVVSVVLDNLAQDLDGLSVGLLKGTALWGDLYRPGEREVSDIDLFVNDGDEARLLSRLTALGFPKQVRSRGRASSFKTVCLGDQFGDLSVEVHTRLWWREPKDFRWQWRPALRAPFLRLTPEDQLIHLCGHWAAQHTMISMHWLFDIVLFLEKYGGQIDRSHLMSRARSMNLSRAVETALKICAERDADLAFLREPRGQLARYFFLKHSLQDSWRVALIYDLDWLRTKLFRGRQ